MFHLNCAVLQLYGVTLIQFLFSLSKKLLTIWNCHELGLFSLFPSLSLARALPVYSSHLFIVAISACAASLSHLFSLVSLLLSTSSICLPCSLSDYFVYVSHACVLCYLHDHLPCLVLLKSSLEELHSSCVLSCSVILLHVTSYKDCFCPTRSSSSAVYPQDRSLPLPRNLSTCVCSSPVSLLDRLPVLLFNKSHYRTYLCTWILCFLWQKLSFCSHDASLHVF